MADFPAYTNGTPDQTLPISFKKHMRSVVLTIHLKTREDRLITVIALVIIFVVGVEVIAEIAIPFTKLNNRLKQIYASESFFDNFNYLYSSDPAEGFVHYAAREAALALNLAYAAASSAILRVDTSAIDTTICRMSGRVESKTTYNSGLFIFDTIHAPYGCSTWPALWLTNPFNCPLNGEIDVVEAANNAADGNQVTLHTTEHCSLDVKRKQTGKSLHSNCYNGTNDNAGCGVQAPASTIGQESNATGGSI